MSKQIVNTYVIEHLYHTTLVNNENTKSYFDDLVEEFARRKKGDGKGEDYIVPTYGEFPQKIDGPKWFTLLPSKYYMSSGSNESVLLKYSLKKPVRLIDFRHFGGGYIQPYLDEIEKDENIDGYIGIEDVTEIYLKKADNHVLTYEILDKNDYPDYIDNYETNNIVRKETNFLLTKIEKAEVINFPLPTLV